MKRRQFINLVGTAGIGTAAPPSHSLPSTQPSRWQPDGVGSLARIGVLTPDFDPVPESEMWAMAPQGVSIHTSRVAWNRDDPRAFAEPPQVDNAVTPCRAETEGDCLCVHQQQLRSWCRSRRPSTRTTREASRGNSGSSHLPGSDGSVPLFGSPPVSADSSAVV
jgi:hypothetical protein